jgi:hypothetical protein
MLYSRLSPDYFLKTLYKGIYFIALAWLKVICMCLAYFSLKTVCEILYPTSVKSNKTGKIIIIIKIFYCIRVISQHYLTSIYMLYILGI